MHPNSLYAGVTKNLFCYVVPSGLYMQLVAFVFRDLSALQWRGIYMKILTDQTPTSLAAKNAVYPHTSKRCVMKITFF